MREILGRYFDTLFQVTREVECTAIGGDSVSTEAAFQKVIELCRRAHERKGKIMFVGNGGSMGIATHMAVDFSKAGGMRSTAFGDGAVLTCLGNDLGFEHVFSKQVEWHGRAEDVLIAISSSGKSADILNAVETARSLGTSVVTFSGFRDDNPLRKTGDVNFYVRATEYGFVEVSHQALLHAILDISAGWTTNK